MNAAKVGLQSFVVKIPMKYFHLPEDDQVVVELHDMHRLLWRKDLDVAMVMLFAM